MEYTWTIAQLERNTADDFVVTVHYRVNAVDGDYTASTYGTVSYTQESETFIPFADLTEATVVGWVKESLGEDTVETALASQIEAQKVPVTVAGMPW
jgi:propanediol dehydratase small subunit